ncbi:hypothetical protein [Halomarina rubra]|uniref:Uncharacterized protein n=1 Tax=Halomarina rubra TaxID=2071873 RepID=A0ABD6AY06_9EURY|nr:hypothetical protein [Halomarina rubra]
MSWRDSWPEGGPDTDEITVEIKSSATRDCGTVRTYVDDHGSKLTFSNKNKARQELMSHTTTAELALQPVAPQDPANVDWYLVSRGQHGLSAFERPPPEEGWTFNPTANQYGALGEALFTATPHGTKPLKQYARRDLGIDDRLKVEIDSDPSVISNSAGMWLPDFSATVGLRRGPVIQRYLCEVKTGSGELERTQAETMLEHSDSGSDDRILQIHATIEKLPDEYTVEFHRIGAR